jgi:hypothetical protein
VSSKPSYGRQRNGLLGDPLAVLGAGLRGEVASHGLVRSSGVSSRSRKTRLFRTNTVSPTQWSGQVVMKVLVTGAGRCVPPGAR